MSESISLEELKTRILDLIHKLELANISELPVIELPIIIYSSYKKKRRYGINTSKLGYTKGGFKAIQFPNDKSILLLIYDETITPKKNKDTY